VRVAVSEPRAATPPRRQAGRAGSLTPASACGTFVSLGSLAN